jgi:DNA repair protein RadA/Sms
MKHAETVFICSQCGSRTPKWLGRCPGCGEFGTFEEETREGEASKESVNTPLGGALQRLNQVVVGAEDRVLSGIGELDRVLGGGLVPGSVVLVGGDPGIGKSTLMLQALAALQKKGLDTLYVSGEESAQQLKMRSMRLGSHDLPILILTETHLKEVRGVVEERRPSAVVVDSVQTMYTDGVSSAPGSLTQVREVAARLVHLSKRTGISFFLVGHVTKEGAIAGPRVLEHMVDTVLYFEGDRGHAFRVLRAVKNRFGSTNEIGVFEMKDSGLSEVSNPSQLLLEERPLDVPGSVVVPCMEGTRPILLELQALAAPSSLGVPRRVTIGVDSARVSLLVAVMEKKAGIQLAGHDLFINVAGGMKTDEPALDLGIVGAIASSTLDRTIPSDTVLFGEIGLSGEIRGVSQVDIRLREAEKMGFKKCFLPASGPGSGTTSGGMSLVGVRSLSEALKLLFS